MTIDKAQLKALVDQGSLPPVVASLLAEIKRLEGCDEVLRNLASYAGYEGYDTAAVDHVGFARQIMEGIKVLNDPLAQLAEKRGVERDQLKAENENLRRYGEEFAALAERRREEAEVLRKDAERYRWLRDECGVVAYKEIAGSIGPGMLPSGEKLEAAIDAAKERDARHV